jgi:hypothetical protein
MRVRLHPADVSTNGSLHRAVRDDRSPTTHGASAAVPTTKDYR